MTLASTQKELYFLIFIYLFMAMLGLVAASGFSLVAASRGCSSLRCSGFSLQWLLLWSMDSRMLRLSNCGSQAQLPWGMWDLPAPGIGPMSPALAGRFLTTGPPGKVLQHYFLNQLTLLKKIQMLNILAFEQNHVSFYIIMKKYIIQYFLLL